MYELIPFVDKLGGTVVELGSRDGHDADKMTRIFRADRTVVIEANPYCYNNIVRDYPTFETHNVAIGSSTGPVDFWKVGEEFGEVVLGQSSLLYKPSYDTIATRISVQGYTMDDFVDAIGIEDIAAMKIDVEGATYEVLEGFSRIRMTRLLHIESEHFEFWDGQKMYDDTALLMQEAGYEQVYFAPVWTNQSDSIWLRRD